MQDLYNELGLKEGASNAELKTAYKDLARIHHPDVGGDEEKFKKINNAYDILKNPKKKAEYLQEQEFEKYTEYTGRPANRPGNIPPDINIIIEAMAAGQDPFRETSFSRTHFGQGFEGFATRQYRRTQQNRDIKVSLTVSLEDIIKTQKKTISVTLASGQREIIEVDIPVGVKNNTFIKYNRLGDNTITTEPRGDLYVNIAVEPHPIFERVNNDLVIHKTIDCIDAMLGSTVTIKTLDKRKLSVTIHKGTQNGTVLKLTGEGLQTIDRSGHHTRFGDMHVVVDVNIPGTLTKDQYDLLRQIKGQK